MATKGSFNTTGYTSSAGSPDYYTFSWELTSQNVANNYSDISYKVVGAGGRSSGSWTNVKEKYVTVNGTTKTNTTLQKTYNGTVAFSGTARIYHNADGTKSFSASCGGAFYYYGSYNTTGSGSWSLPTIPRASKPSVTGTLQLGSTITINTNRASSSFTHTVKYSWGSYSSGTIASSVGTSTTWTIPKDLANGIPNGTSGTLVITLETYNGTTYIGTSSTSVTVSIPNTSEFNPTISNITLNEAVSGLNAQFGGFIKGKSQISGSVSASGIYGSTIKTYAISINGQSLSSKDFTTSYLNGSGSCEVIVTDSRNRSVTLTKNYTCYDYENPQISIFNVARCNQDGTLNDEGSNVLCIINAIISNINNKNTKAFKLQYKKQTETTYIDVALSNESYELNTNKIIENIDTDFEYDFKLVVTDYFGTSERIFEVGTGFSLINFNSNGKAIAFGKVSKYQNAVEFAMPIYDKFDTQIRNGIAAYVSGGEDANTTLDEIALCSKNVPLGTEALFYVRTMFYLDKTSTSNRTQIAYPYSNISHGVYIRIYSDENWSNWTKISS